MLVDVILSDDSMGNIGVEVGAGRVSGQHCLIPRLDFKSVPIFALVNIKIFTGDLF